MKILICWDSDTDKLHFFSYYIDPTEWETFVELNNCYIGDGVIDDNLEDRINDLIFDESGEFALESVDTPFDPRQFDKVIKMGQIV